MNRSDRAKWAQARTLAGLGELGAQWLEGAIASEPGYTGPCDADETLPLVPPLAALNRSGYYTTCSQPGCDETGPDRVRWEQRAAVEGFAAPALMLQINDAAWRAGLFVVAHDPRKIPRWRIRCRGEVPCTRRNGENYTWFGQHISRRYIRDPHLGWGICHPDAVNALCGAWQVTVIDPEWGRPGLLWDVLGGICAGRTA